MGTVMEMAILRFKMKSGFSSKSNVLEKVRGVLGEPETIEYDMEWNSSKEQFESTSEVAYFSYPQVKCGYNIVWDEDDNYYLDYYLDYPHESLDDTNFSIDVGYLNSKVSEILEKFGSLVLPEARLKVFCWYTGCDMPVEW